MNKEEWKPIKEYENLYEISNYGRIRSLDRKIYHYASKNKLQLKRGKIIKPINNGKYYVITLSKNGKLKQYYVHKLVAQAFISNPNNLPEVNHKDENKLNNNVNNLEWCNRKYNCNYGTRNERIIAKKSKPVNQYDLDGNFIRTWKSATEAAKILKINDTSITRCCRKEYGAKTSGGSKWEYVN